MVGNVQRGGKGKHQSSSRRIPGLRSGDGALVDWTGLFDDEFSFFVVSFGEFPMVNEVRRRENSGGCLC